MNNSVLRLIDMLTNRKQQFIMYSLLLGLVLTAVVYSAFLHFGTSGQSSINPLVSDDFMLSVMIGFCVPFLLIYLLYQKAHDIKKHGTARFAFVNEINLHTNPAPNSVVIGGHKLKYNIDKPHLFKGTYLFDDSPAPVTIVAPNRSGKNVGFTIPSCFWWNDSAVVFDVRGEHYKYTAGARSRYAGRTDNNWKGAMGSRILAFNPTAKHEKEEDTLPSCGYNALQEVPLGTPEEISSVQDIAQMIVDPEDSGRTSGSAIIFNDNAVILLTGAILQTLYSSRIDSRSARISQADLKARSVRIRNNDGSVLLDDDGAPVKAPCLGAVLDTLSDVKEILDALIFNKDDTEDEAKGIRAVFKKWALMPHSEAYSYECEPWWGLDEPYHPQIQQIAAEMMAKPSRELGSIVSTAVSKLGIFRDPNIRRNTSESIDHHGSPWAISDLMNKEQPTTLYILPSPESRERLKPLIRLLFVQVINRFTRGHDVKRKRQLLLLIDEFTSLGRIKQLETAFSYIAGYGIKPYLVLQDINQLYNIYGHDESIIANSRTRIACAPAEYKTAKYLSDSVGVQTFSRRSRSRTSGTIARPGSRTASTDLSARPLLTPDEIMRLKLLDPKKGVPGECLILSQGEPTIMGTTPMYFYDPFMMELSKIPVPFPNVLVSDGMEEEDTNIIIEKEDSDSFQPISDFLVGDDLKDGYVPDRSVSQVVDGLRP